MTLFISLPNHFVIQTDTKYCYTYYVFISRLGINPEVSETVYCTAVRYGDERVWEFVMDRLQVENVETETHKLLKALTCTPHKWLQTK